MDDQKQRVHTVVVPGNMDRFKLECLPEHGKDFTFKAYQCGELIVGGELDIRRVGEIYEVYADDKYVVSFALLPENPGSIVAAYVMFNPKEPSSVDDGMILELYYTPVTE